MSFSKDGFPIDSMPYCPTPPYVLDNLVGFDQGSIHIEQEDFAAHVIRSPGSAKSCKKRRSGGVPIPTSGAKMQYYNMFLHNVRPCS
jgi:hypothetical protein